MASWRIDFEGKTYREADLTLNDVERICDVTGTDWVQVHPLRSPAHLKAVLGLFLERGGESFDAACKRIGDMSASALLDTIDHDTDDTPDAYVDGVPPLATGSPSTD